MNYIYEELIIKNNDFWIKKDILLNQIYENDFFDLIKITGDGNCFFRSVSYFLYKNENKFADLRNAVYLYVKNNINKFYEFCYVENNTYYLDIEEGEEVHKYVLDDYIEKIQYNTFFSGFIEMNAAAIILNKIIVILDNIKFQKYVNYYSKLAMFNKSEKEIFDIKEIIFINFVSKNHYQLLNPNIQFIKNRILKLSIIYFNCIKYDTKTKKILDIYNDMTSFLNSEGNLDNEDEVNNLDKANKLDKKNKIPPKKKKNEKNSSLSNTENNSFEESSNSLKEKENLDKKIQHKESESNKKDIDENSIYFSEDYDKALNNLKEEKILYIENDIKIEYSIPFYPILISDKINTQYYSEIYKYLYVEKFDINISRYPESINNIKILNTRDNKKKEFRNKCHKYYLDDNKKLCRLISIRDNENYNINSKYITYQNQQYRLGYIPETKNILQYLYNMHKEDGHKGIASLRKYLDYHNIYIEGSTYLTDYIVKNCTSCAGKNKNKLKREPSKQIITFYPKQRYIMDLTEIPIDLKSNNKFNYLFDIIDHFSKFGMSYAIENKESKTILNYLKIALECNGFPSELGSDNGKEFCNKQIENYLKEKNIKFIHGMPYNPHSQGVVERFHKTIKDTLCCIHNDDPENFDIKDQLEIVIKKYNNHIHSSTKFSPNSIFYSTNESLFKQVLANIKKSFRDRGNEVQNFEENEKCLLNKKFKIKKKGNNKKVGVLVFDKIKKKNLYGKINVTIINKSGTNYKIRIAKDYEDYNLFENDVYLAEYKLLSKCKEDVWLKLLKRDLENDKSLIIEDILSEDISVSDEEKEFIEKHIDELN